MVCHVRYGVTWAKSAVMDLLFNVLVANGERIVCRGLPVLLGKLRQRAHQILENC